MNENTDKNTAQQVSDYFFLDSKRYDSHTQEE
jgi:hypothetical protein